MVLDALETEENQGGYGLTGSLRRKLEMLEAWAEKEAAEKKWQRRGKLGQDVTKAKGKASFKKGGVSSRLQYGE